MISDAFTVLYARRNFACSYTQSTLYIHTHGRVCLIREMNHGFTVPAWGHSPGWCPGRALDYQDGQHRVRQRRCVVLLEPRRGSERRCVVLLETRRGSEPPAERCADSPSVNAPDPAEPPAASAPSPAPDDTSSPDSGQPDQHTHRQTDRQTDRGERQTGSGTCCMSPSRLSVELVRTCRFAKASLYGTDSDLT